MAMRPDMDRSQAWRAARLEREEAHVGRVARGALQHVLHARAARQRGRAVLAPVHLRLLAQARVARLAALHLQHHQLVARLRHRARVSERGSALAGGTAA